MIHSGHSEVNFIGFLVIIGFENLKKDKPLYGPNDNKVICLLFLMISSWSTGVPLDIHVRHTLFVKNSVSQPALPLKKLRDSTLFHRLMMTVADGAGQSLTATNGRSACQYSIISSLQFPAPERRENCEKNGWNEGSMENLWSFRQRTLVQTRP